MKRRSVLPLLVLTMLVHGCTEDVTTQTVVRFSAAATLDVPPGTTIRVRAWRQGERQHETGTDLGTFPFVDDTQVVINAADNDASRRFTLFAELLDAAGTRLSWARVRTGHLPDEVSEVRVQFAADCLAPSDQVEQAIGFEFFASCGSHDTCVPEGAASACAFACYAPEPFVAALGETASTPQQCPIEDGFPIEELHAGWDLTCARGGGEVFCWGQHSLRADTRRPRPARVIDVRGHARPDTADPIVSMSFNVHTTCALHESGRLACGGLRGVNQAGVEFPDGPESIPCCNLVPDVPPLVDHQLGRAIGYGVTEDGVLLATGGSPTFSETFVPYMDVVGVRSLLVGHDRFIAYVDDGDPAFRGGDFEAGNLPPDPSVFVDVESRVRTVCGVTVDTELLCWGRTPTNEGAPAQPTSFGTGWARFALGLAHIGNDETNHACGVRTDGTLWCWGENTGLRLGASVTSASADDPVQVGTDTDWADVEPGRTIRVR